MLIHQCLTCNVLGYSKMEIFRKEILLRHYYFSEFHCFCIPERFCYFCLLRKKILCIVESFASDTLILYDSIYTLSSRRFSQIILFISRQKLAHKIVMLCLLRSTWVEDEKKELHTFLHCNRRNTFNKKCFRRPISVNKRE